MLLVRLVTAMEVNLFLVLVYIVGFKNTNINFIIMVNLGYDYYNQYTGYSPDYSYSYGYPSYGAGSGTG